MRRPRPRVRNAENARESSACSQCMWRSQPKAHDADLVRRVRRAQIMFVTFRVTTMYVAVHAGLSLRRSTGIAGNSGNGVPRTFHRFASHLPSFAFGWCVAQSICAQNPVVENIQHTNAVRDVAPALAVHAAPAL